MSGRTTPSGIPGRRESMSFASPASSAPGGGHAPNTTSVKVALRIRPAGSSESVPTRFQRVAVHPLNSTTLQLDPVAGQPKGAKSTFTFDHVIGPDDGQTTVYETTGVDALVDSFVAGMNTTILAYGQTSSGKSYTMGTDRLDDDLFQHNPERLGITPRAVSAIFERIKLQTKSGTTFQAKVSYVEIYNEDLIDLLAGDADVRPLVQIREDKNGTIIWSGLREVKVNNAQEVMNALLAGSALRQTNATDMNAQSSRSHAIFSLTLTQKRYTGTGPPPSPTRSPGSRRISSLPRVTSPTPGSRSGTPTSDRPGSRIGGLRPPSSLGALSSGRASPAPVVDEDRAESWVTVVSKFHFVDLAGSERLKRTAAAGERVKEGISINSGLHALGNVISALGDPARARQTTHIPYRDSKLTRLLQDSLGGNAQTMMVACVSPTEFNLSETISTVKYANRARNIKNRAEVNEVEVGWDDVEYLQKTITRLRGEMAALKGGEAMSAISEEHGGDASARGGMDDKYAELTTRVAQLKTELAAAQASSSAFPGVAGSEGPSLTRDDFARAVEPIVEEYEKSLSALESQLSLTQAALKHAEEEMDDLQAKHQDDLKTQEASSGLISELRTKVAKLIEREATTEAYVRDLEAKLKDYGDQDDEHGSAVSDLRKEITRHREHAQSTEQYVKELEGRLARSDEGAAALRRQVEVLERDVERREEAYLELEGRLTLLDTTKDHKQLLAEIDERDKKLLDLERSLDDLKSQHGTSEAEVQRLQKVADEEKEAKEELQSRVRTLERASMSFKGVRPASYIAPQTPTESPNDTPDTTPVNNEGVDALVVAGLEQRIKELESTHKRTLTELEIANAKYRDSLKEIEDLNNTVQEVKLNGVSDSDVAPSPSSTTFGHTAEDDSDLETLSETAVGHPGDLRISTTPNGSRLNTPRSRRSMPLAPGHRLSFLGRGGGSGVAASHLRSASLSQELSSAQGSHFSTPPSPRPHSPSPSLNPRDSIVRDVFSSPTSERSSNERTYDQMKNEVMKLQHALTEREAEISELERTLQQQQSLARSVDKIDTGSRTPPRIVTPDALSPLASPDVHLSPKTRATFDALKAELHHSSSDLASENIDEDSSVRLDNLMRSMAKKESVHRETVDQLEDDLATLKRQHDELTVLSRDQVVNMSSEIDRLRTSLEGRPEASHYEGRLKCLQDDLSAKDAEVELTRKRAADELETTRTSLSEEHQRAVASLAAEHTALLLEIRNQHADVLRRQTEDHSEALRLRRVDHESALQSKIEEMDNALKRKADEHDEVTRRFEIEQASLVDSGKESFASAVELLNAEHAALLAKRETNFTAELEKLKQDHSTALETRDSTHAEAVATLQEEHDRSLVETISTHSESLSRVREEHDASLAKLKEEHASTVGDLQSQHAVALESTTASHAAKLVEVNDSHNKDVEAKLAELSSSHAEALQVLSTQHEAVLSALAESQSTTVAEASAGQQDALNSLKEAHASEITALRQSHDAALAAADEQRRLDLESHTKSIDEAHNLAITGLMDQHHESLASLTSTHETALSRLKSDHELALAEQSKSHVTAFDEVKALHAKELGTIVTERDAAIASHNDVFSKHELLAGEHSATQEALVLAKTDQETLRNQITNLQETHEASTTGLQSKVSALETSLATATSKSSTHETTAQELQEALDALSTLEKALVESQEDRERLVGLLEKVQTSRDEDRVKLTGLTTESEDLKAALAKVEEDLVRSQAERDNLTADVARLSTRATASDGEAALLERAKSPTNEGTPSRLLNGLTNGKPPPPTPPPSMPPPPLPSALPGVPPGRSARSSSSSSIITPSMQTSRDSTSADTAASSIRPMSVSSTIDPRVSKKLEEQEIQIAKLTKQLTHCESDLHANIDLVNTLESALNDSERNLRKARQQMGDLARERDNFLGQNEQLRRENQEKATEAETMRHSVIQVESQYQEARRQKDEATRQLQSRLKDVSSNKGKFVCF